MTNTASTFAVRGREDRPPGLRGGDRPAAEARAVPARARRVADATDATALTASAGAADTAGAMAPGPLVDRRPSSLRLALRQAAVHASAPLVAQARAWEGRLGAPGAPVFPGAPGARASRRGFGGAGAAEPVVQRMPVETAEARLQEWVGFWDVTIAEGMAAALAAWVTDLEDLLAGDWRATQEMYGEVEGALTNLAVERMGGAADASWLDEPALRSIAEGIRNRVPDVVDEAPDETGMRGMPVAAPLPWVEATGAAIKTSGNGGIAIVRFAGGVVVAKGAGAMANREVLAARLARELGLRAPTTRLLEEGEADAIETALAAHGKRMPARPREGSSAPTLVMEYVEGTDLGEVGAGLEPAAVASLARSMGAWLAFDILINERDRFPSVRGEMVNSVNSGNLRVVGDEAPELVGIDQQVSVAAEPSPALARALAADVTLYRDAAAALGSLTGGQLDAEVVAALVQAGAEGVFARMGQRLDADALARLAGDLGIDAEVTDRLLQTLAAIADRFRG